MVRTRRRSPRREARLSVLALCDARGCRGGAERPLTHECAREDGTILRPSRRHTNDDHASLLVPWSTPTLRLDAFLTRGGRAASGTSPPKNVGSSRRKRRSVVSRSSRTPTCRYLKDAWGRGGATEGNDGKMEDCGDWPRRSGEAQRAPQTHWFKILPFASASARSRPAALPSWHVALSWPQNQRVA